LGGRHVVFVRYGANHSIHDEWVYNAANIDGAPVVWCRATDSADEAEVTHYYKGRRFWIANVDSDGARLSHYESAEFQPGVVPRPPGNESQEWVWKGQ
jgi:hypothetical protein